MKDKYSDIALNLCLCAITAAGVGDTQNDPEYVYDKVQRSLQLSPATRDKFKLVWGPAVLRIDDDGDVRDDYMLYMVQNVEDEADLRLAVRYTLSSKNSQEDFLFAPTVAWQRYGADVAEDVKINLGMGMVMDDIRDIKSNNAPGKDKTIIDFVREHQNSHGLDSVTLTVCGHSFGGIVAPVLGLYIKEQLKADDIQVKIHAGGATTVGNESFANYINEVFGADYTRLVNENDITGLLWDPKEMQRFITIYLPDYPLDELFAQIFESLRLLIQITNLGGTQAGNVVSFKQPLNSAMQSFTEQAQYQHSTGFFDYYNIKQRKESDPDNGEDVVLPDEGTVAVRLPF